MVVDYYWYYTITVVDNGGRLLLVLYTYTIVDNGGRLLLVLSMDNFSVKKS